MVRRDILGYLTDQGFLGSSVEITCAKATTHCVELNIKISEGPQYTIDSIILEGQPLPEPTNYLAQHITKLGGYALGSTLAGIRC